MVGIILEPVYHCIQESDARMHAYHDQADHALRSKQIRLWLDLGQYILTKLAQKAKRSNVLRDSKISCRMLISNRSGTIQPIRHPLRVSRAWGRSEALYRGSSEVRRACILRARSVLRQKRLRMRMGAKQRSISSGRCVVSPFGFYDVVALVRFH